MDFQTSDTGIFDDDRMGWMTANPSTDSDIIFGVQMDPETAFRIEGYWDHVINDD